MRVCGANILKNIENYLNISQKGEQFIKKSARNIHISQNSITFALINLKQQTQ